MDSSRIARTATLLTFALAMSYAQQTTVAVLPSDNAGSSLGNEELEALTDKMREAALAALPIDVFILLKQDVVIKRLGGAENYIKECSKNLCIVNLGKKAQVDYVAQASVGKLGNKIRLKAELYNVSTGGLLGMFSGLFDDYFVLLESIDKNMQNVFKKIPIPAKQPAGSANSTAHAIYTSQPALSVSYDSLIDLRDGKKYKTVKIASQTWIAENLNYESSASTCYQNKESNCEECGRLYDWETALKVCPAGWRLPSDEDWDNLASAVGGISVAGTILKSKKGWRDGWEGGDMDKHGFSARPCGGAYNIDYFGNSFGNYSLSAIFWSATEKSIDNAWTRTMHTNKGVMPKTHIEKIFKFSVRCVKD